MAGFVGSDKIRAMDISHRTSVVFDKIHQFEPELAGKIIGYLLLQDHGELEMASLASYPDYLIRDVVCQAKMELQKLAAKPDMLPISLIVNPPLPHPQQGLSHLSVMSPRTPTSPNFQVPPHYWDPQPAGNINSDFMAMNYVYSVKELQKQTQLCSLENSIDAVKTGTVGVANDYYGDASANNLGGKAAGRRFSDFPMKVCHYFNKGFCKHGTSCRFYHGQVAPENFSQTYGYDAIGEDQVISPGSLAQLESELVELLRSRGSPISIASLPMAYSDKFNKVLQAEGYLTESQRHGKSGYSLTKLLARLKNSIRLIGSYRPHGQHSVVLADDAPTQMQKGEFARNISASRQIYLTFPADSTFTEDDVSNYFTTFGPVADVRIPNQQRRMFGFVTFVHPETVKTVLDKGNPHSVRGSRVLVKPYREKAKVNERKYADIEHTVCCSPHYVDTNSELNSIPKSFGNHRSFRRQLIEEQEQALELERSLAQLPFSPKPLSSSHHFGFSLNETTISDDNFDLQTSEESFRFPLHGKSRHTYGNFSHGESIEGLNLPDSPFAFPINNEK
ncbi:unnamed protein product [Sphenostylis stenocarpa]|uniref:Zinc finger CCCH domain-containing protein 18-like n=1 Tax=Sphenostylis stenocarpa TaxID=92480 RepID=A0AA86W029_9FABA|nr:unnamed protein product [Sphenostylis stenocarpa]